jgi:hypothetical protein
MRRHEVERRFAQNFLGRVAQNLPDLRADVGVDGVFVDFPHPVAGGLDHVAEALLALPEGGFGLLAGGDVVNEGDLHASALDGHAAQAYFDGQYGAVFTPAYKVPAHAHRAYLPGSDERRALPDMRGAVFLGDQDLHGLPNQFRTAVAEDLLRLGVDELDAPLPVHYYNAFGSGFEIGAQPCLALHEGGFHPAALGDVGREDEPGRAPLKRQVRSDDFDRDDRAVFLPVPPQASVLIRFEVIPVVREKAGHFFGRADAVSGGGQEFFPGIAVVFDSSVIHRQKRQCFDVVNPHGMRVFLKHEAIRLFHLHT